MSKYIPLNLKWRFTTWNGFRQWRSLIYRIYINIFGIFLRIPILPLSISWKDKTLDIWYRGDELIILYKKGIRRYISLGCEGEFKSLREVDDFWRIYGEACSKLPEIEEERFDFKG
jgi:hypothetical protein